MEKIETVAGMSAEEMEELFKERATAAVEALGIKPFQDMGLEAARSEKEIEKCIEKAEARVRRAEAAMNVKEEKDTKGGKRTWKHGSKKTRQKKTSRSYRRR